MADRLVTIAQFSDYIEAELARQLLADYGIEAVATDQNASNVYSIPAIAAPELQVPESQAEQALKILQSSKEQEQQEGHEEQQEE